MPEVKSHSFRDPMGIVFKYNDRILRLIKREHEKDFQELINHTAIHAMVKEKVIPRNDVLPESEFLAIAAMLPNLNENDQQSEFSQCVEHEAVFFPSYPYEWAPEMLHAAAQFTLELALKLLKHNLGLKDANPYNVLFKGCSPIFVDLLSFEGRDPKDPIWLPYAQFVRSFLLPLIANKFNKTPISQIFFNNSDGLSPEEVYQTSNLKKFTNLSLLSLVTLPTLFDQMQKKKKESSIYQKKQVNNPEKAKFILRMVLKGLQRHLKRLKPVPKQSKWTDYSTAEESYNKRQFQAKVAIVSKLLDEASPKRVLDIGCNTGFFSILAAGKGASVVGIDSDPNVIGLLWHEAKQGHHDVLPLVVDICRPSPAIGWKNAEHLSFLERSQNAFNVVLMLAVVHHMAITCRIPLEDIAHMTANITNKHLIIEYIAPEDPMFRRLVRGRDHLYAHMTKEHFEKVFSKHFVILSAEKVGDNARWMYFMEKRI